MSDVSFGGDGATKPLPLTDTPAPVVTRNLGAQELRLVRDFIPHQTHRTPEARMWIYQYRNDPGAAWNSFYAFADGLEFLEQDFAVMNFFTGTSADSFLTYTMVIVKFLMRVGTAVDGNEDDAEGEIVGKVMLVDGDVKINKGGRTSVVLSCRTERERVDALKEYFGITLSPEEQSAIIGTVRELKG